MSLIRQAWITRRDLQSNPTVLYAFGDNEERWGLGGQAKEMRGEPNAIGIATLKAPGRYWSETDAVRQCAVIDADLAPLFDAMRAGGLVVFPLDGVGTGLAALEHHSPTTFLHLQIRLDELQATTPNI